jgi:hypothetical protein
MTTDRSLGRPDARGQHLALAQARAALIQFPFARRVPPGVCLRHAAGSIGPDGAVSTLINQ